MVPCQSKGWRELLIQLLDDTEDMKYIREIYIVMQQGVISTASCIFA